MSGMFRNPPRLDGTDEAARRILELLQREEREKQALRRLEAEGWRAPEDSAPPGRERRFGDGRDDLMQMVQADLDQRQALQDEARRRGRSNPTAQAGNNRTGTFDPAAQTTCAATVVASRSSSNADYS